MRNIEKDFKRDSFFNLLLRNTFKVQAGVLEDVQPDEFFYKTLYARVKVNGSDRVKMRE